jgi:septal ring factor EnvC (AmiA/AmiB activator)
LLIFVVAFLFICSSVIFLKIRRKNTKEHIEKSINNHLQLISNYVHKLNVNLSQEHNTVTLQLCAAEKERAAMTKEVKLINNKLKTVEKENEKLAKQMKNVFAFVIVTFLVIAALMNVIV